MPMPGTMNQLQCLDDELNVTNRAHTKFDLAPNATAAAQFGLNPILGLPNGRSNIIGRRTEDQRLCALKEFLSPGPMSSHDASLEQYRRYSR